jgi:hypothetical protein
MKRVDITSSSDKSSSKEKDRPKRVLTLEEDHPNELVRLMKKNKVAENSQMIYIGIDGYYGDDKFMTLLLVRKATRKVVEVVTSTFHIKDLSRIVWVCPLGSWMKCLPLFLITEGIGHHVEFVAPCGEIKSTAEGLYIDTRHSANRNGGIVFKSIELMDQRLNENESRRLCRVPPTLQIIANMVREKKAYIHDTEQWRDQRKKMQDLAQYVIVLPYHDPNTLMTEEQEKDYRNKFGGSLYFSKLPQHRELINLWDLVRECALQINDSLHSDSNKDLTNVVKHT